MDDELKRLIAKRKKKGSQGLPLALAAAVGAVVVTALVGFLLFARGESRSASWTHREMAAHLAARGCKYTMAEADQLNAAYLCLDPDTRAAASVANGGTLLPGVVKFAKAQSESDAREWVGHKPPGAAIFRWGVWVFEGDRAMLAAIEKALR